MITEYWLQNTDYWWGIHSYPLQLCTQTAEAMAVSTVMIRLMIFFPESEPGAHARHYNAHSIGICYEGGLDANGRPADTRTPAQKAAMRELLKSLCTDYPEAEILGHRDLPGVHKECPCFDVKKWLTNIHFHI